MVEVLSLRSLLDNEGSPFRRGWRNVDVIVEEKRILAFSIVRGEIYTAAATGGGLAELRPSTRKSYPYPSPRAPGTFPGLS